MDYSLRELECFTAVVEELSFTRAAARLHLAQPPLSRHIRTLEEKIGAQLFEREARKVSVTAAGMRFYEETRGILFQLARASETARRTAHGEVARLRLGFVSTVLSSELVDIFRLFRQQHPGVQIVLQDLSPAEQLQQITAGMLDGGFIGILPNEHPSGLQFTPWRQDPLSIFLPSGHPLSTKKQLHLTDLSTAPFVAVSSEAAPAYATLVHEICHSVGFKPRIVLESARAQAVAVMVAAGSGVAILPHSIAHLMGNSVTAVPFKPSSIITHVFAHPAGTPDNTMTDFLKQLTGKKRKALR